MDFLVYCYLTLGQTWRHSHLLDPSYMDMEEFGYPGLVQRDVMRMAWVQHDAFLIVSLTEDNETVVNLTKFFNFSSNLSFLKPHGLFSSTSF